MRSDTANTANTAATAAGAAAAAAAAAVVALVTGLATPARACEYSHEAKVVGFNATGSQALLRRQFADLTIAVVELASGKVVESFEILSNDELRDEKASAKVRAQRWKAVEAQLVKRGFKIVPDYPEVKGDIKPGIKLDYRGTAGDSEETSYWTGSELLAKRGTEETVLASTGNAPPSDAGGFGPVYLSPGGRYLITSFNGCGDDLYVVSMDNLELLLPAPEPPAVPPGAPAAPSAPTTAAPAKPR